MAVSTASETQDFHAAARELHIDGRLVIGGHRVPAADQATLDSLNPATGEVIAAVAKAGTDDVNAAVAGAKAVFEAGTWALADPADRAAVLKRLADLIDEHRLELALLDSLEMGKPVVEALTGDVVRTADNYRWYAEAIDKVVDEVPVTPHGSTAIVSREPLGVIGVITPWNYPLEISSWKLAPALALGNSVVHKPASPSSLSALRIADLALEAGLPPHVLNVVPGSGSGAGNALAEHMDIDALAFTGSTPVAKQLLAASGASNMKRLCLEAGGKSANVVFADVDDLDQAAEYAAMAVFYNQGEVCSANTRLLVEESIAEEFISKVVDQAAAYEPGDPLAAEVGNGAMVSAEHAREVMDAIDLARRDGTVRCGGERVTINGVDTFIRPTVVTDLPADHSLFTDEVFGPLLVVQTFSSEDEAVRLANSTPYALAASLWTGSMARAHRVSARLVAGTVSVNTVDALGTTTPFGGFKQSGFGRDLSLHAFNNYSDLKTTWYQFG